MSIKPTIAAVNGMAMAGGWLFAQMCDLCVAAEHATFAITEARVGRGFPWAAPLIHMLPQRIMMELLLTGEPMSAARLHALGYVNHVVPREELLARSLELAGRIAAERPAHRCSACRALVYAATETGRTQALRAGRRAVRVRLPERWTPRKGRAHSRRSVHRNGRAK